MNETSRQAAEEFKGREYRDLNGRSWPYRLLVPRAVDETRQYPLVLFLHGSGERGNDNFRQLTHGVWRFALENIVRDFPCFVVAPQCPENARWVDAEWRETSLRQKPEPTPELAATLEIISALEEEFPIDPRGISIVGISMGGFGAWDLITRFPDVFSAAVPICGAGDATKAPLLGKMKVWAFHGADDDVVPVEGSRRMVEAIRAAGGAPRYTEYPGTGHNSWALAFEEPAFFSWLLSQRLGR